ncbi:MAG TPA: hypothetical protein VMP01_08140 [Pirellulaceae bacterium]|nr:hypothetical protein [Pirellulaceae bacterium]
MTSTNIPFLVLHRYHQSAAKAREAVIGLFHHLGQQRPKGGWDTSTFTLARDGKSIFSMSFPDMVKEARHKGVVVALQRILDRQDGVFGGIGVFEFATANYQVKHGTEFAGFKAEVQGPCRVSLVEEDLTEDILHYRRLACNHSSDYNFRLTARYFRNYLSACTSIIDAFVNRHILVAKADGFTSPELDELERTTKVEKRLELWWNICCNSDPSPLFKSVHWCRFQEIRQKRNALLHALDPFGIYSLPEIQQYMNKVRSGIGELLLLLRAAHKKPTLGFIERLRTAPKVAYQQIHLRQDGDRVVRVDQG